MSAEVYPGFSWGGEAIPKVGMLTYFLLKNCIKMKEFGPGRGGTSLVPPLIRQWSLQLVGRVMENLRLSNIQVCLRTMLFVLKAFFPDNEKNQQKSILSELI